MGQTGRRSIATHILAVKIALTVAHFHGFGVARQGPWITRVKKGKSKGWAMGKPTSNSGKEKELLRR
jgi:ABC-type phosphate/phosphonate transport system substrate-binding protein